jgi:hypothetical protein
VLLHLVFTDLYTPWCVPSAAWLALALLMARVAGGKSFDKMIAKRVTFGAG